ncbi:MAG: hypothetical protein H0T89_01260 [Deltaproteobacteria bacterium]|nr:hypothetical protein [Deltaproteobacteria bacterium]
MSCNVACSAPDGACPSGLVCGSDGLCKSNGASNCVTEDATRDSIVMDTLRCFGDGLFRTCIPDGPLPINVNISDAQKIDTGDPTNCSYVEPPGTEGVCVVYADQILIQSSGVVRVLGARPLVLLGITSVRVDGILDAASHRADGTVGAGASTGAACGNVAGGASSSSDGGGGGGAGGSFVGRGGSGGWGGVGTAGGSPAAGSTPGSTMVTPTGIRGGCGGSGGGGIPNATPGGLPGAGGGAVYLISGGQMTINGTINASGAGGAVSAARTGGGGGGSGGFIGLDAPTISIGQTAKIFAIGGSGASGGNDSGAGMAGGEAMNALPPPNTFSGSTGGAGSAGGVGSAGGASGGASSGGGGGGGGGGGYIGTAGPTTVTGGTFAPPARPM